MPNKETPQKNSARNTPKSDAPPRFSEDTHKQFHSPDVPADEGAEIRESGEPLPSQRESEVTQPKSDPMGRRRSGNTQTH